MPERDDAGTPRSQAESIPHAPAARDARHPVLLWSVLVVATCGLVYELISATLASYLLGDSVTQFSLVIGVYLSAMGLGSWLSAKIERRLHEAFIQVQCVIAVVGGLSAPILFFGFAHMESVRPLLFAILILVGTMVGLEIPLMMRIMQAGGGTPLKDLVARVLAFDYLGSLLASLCFPLLLLPHLGLVRTSLMFGVINGAVALWCARVFSRELRRPRVWLIQSGAITLFLAVLWVLGAEIESYAERELFEGRVVLTKRTPYQRLTITRWSDDWRLYIDGNLQFSSADEYRYHESLVHPVAAAHRGPLKRALILGGGDGMAARELLRYDELERIDLVDLDPEMTGWFADHPALAALNDGALRDPKVEVANADGMRWLQERLAAVQADPSVGYDVVVIDLPDPNNFSLGKLYTGRFYALVAAHLRPGGVAIVQATSPQLSPHAFWCIVETLAREQLHPLPLHVHVPAFGDWGFVLFSPEPFDPPHALRPAVDLRFLDDATLRSLFVFPRDLAPVDVEPNRLNDQLLVHYYEADLAALVGGRARGAGGP